MVRSRDLSPARRRATQNRFADLIKRLNRDYRKAVASKFIITLGDEFQSLLNTASIVPEIIWRLESDFPDRELRVGIGLGKLDTPIQPYAINMDGPVLHRAREAINDAKRAKILGGIFRGFGEWDSVLNGLAGLLWFQRSQWTPAQRRIASLLRCGMSQADIAAKLRIRPQVVSRQVQSSGCVQYVAGERAWSMILRNQIDPLLHSKHGRVKFH